MSNHSVTSQSRKKGLLLVIIGCMLWGISGTAAQYLFQQQGFSQEWLVEIRLLVSGIVLLLYVRIKERQDLWQIWKDKQSLFNLLLFGIVGMIGVQYTYFAAVLYGNAATATILQYLSPVIVTSYFVIRTKKLPTKREFAAIALAMVGTYFIITGGNIHNMSISKLAVFWGISSAFAAAFYTLQPRTLLTKWSSGLLVGWGMTIGGIAFAFVHPPWEFTGHWSMNSLFAVIIVVLFGTIIAFYCYLESLKYIQPTEASVLSSVEPLSAALLSVLCLRVPLGMSQWLGTVCIICTVFLLSSTKEKTEGIVLTQSVANSGEN